MRKRYIGDYDHAVLATRASGSGNSARSLVYADGILLSNLLGNGAGFTPRWGLVAPEEIERVDVLYGPFSAAYSGNSAGAIVDFVTRMPTRFEAHAKLQGFAQPYRLYGTDDTYSGGQGSASVGSRAGAFSWWLALSHLTSDAQPMSFVVKNVPATTSAAGIPVTGAFADRNPREVPGYVLGTTQQTRTLQDHAKLKLAYDFTPTLRASYTLGWWRNDADRAVDSFLRDASGATVTSGPTPVPVNIDGRSYTVLPTDFSRSTAPMDHFIHGLVVKSNTRGEWDFEVAASLYDYARDIVRSQVPNAGNASAGRITDQHGTGWNTLAAKGTWRPGGSGSAHVVEFGAQRDAYKLETLVSDTPDWSGGEAAARFSAFAGRTSLTSLWAQDAWRFAPDWRAVLGVRGERWQAEDGSLSNATTTLGFAPRSESYVSPKAALSWQASEAWLLRTSLGRAVRMPTVSELFQGSISANEIVNNDPNLKPEKSWTSELTAERAFVGGSARATLFFEETKDALYSQVNVAAAGTVATIQNVDRIRTVGVEGAATANDVARQGTFAERQRHLCRLEDHAERQVPGQRRQVAAARAALARRAARELRRRRALVGQRRHALLGPAVRPARQLRHERLRLHRLQQVLRRRPARAIPDFAIVGDLGRDRQSEQLPLLGVSPLPAAHLPRRAALRPVGVARLEPIRRLS